MILDFKDVKIQVHIDKENSFASKNTGALLSSLMVSRTIRGKTNNDEFLSLIDQAKIEGVTSVNEKGEVQKRWKIGNTSWSNQEGNPIYQHTLELTEVEQMNISSLKLGTLSVQPYKYEENHVDDSLEIEAKVSLSEAQYLQLKTMQKDNSPIPVIRHGINEEPKEMRFGFCYWSFQNAEYKVHLDLYEEKPEEKPSPLSGTFRWMRPLRNQVADNKAAIDSLLNVLRNKNVLTEDDVVAIHKDIDERSWDVMNCFFRVDDIEDL